jgi:hypothetical protein
MTITTKFSTTPHFTYIDPDIKVFVTVNDSEMESIKTAFDILKRHPALFSIDILTGDPEIEGDPDIYFGFSCFQVFRTGAVYWSGIEKWSDSDFYQAFIFEILDDNNIVTIEEQP